MFGPSHALYQRAPDHRVIILAGRKFGEQERRVRVDRGTASREQLKFPGQSDSNFQKCTSYEVKLCSSMMHANGILSMGSYQNVSIS